MKNMTTDFKDALKNRILVFDGGMGTQIHTFDLPLSLIHI
jgi:methionine synthase I (cobalamin-dependent)